MEVDEAYDEAEVMRLIDAAYDEVEEEVEREDLFVTDSQEQGHDEECGVSIYLYIYIYIYILSSQPLIIYMR